MKRLISLIFVVLLVVSIMPASWINRNIEAKGTVIDSGKWEGLEWEFTSDNVLTFYGTGKIEGYWQSSEYVWELTPWQIYSNMTESIVIKNGVTSIGEDAFNWWYQVKTVSLPSTLVSIGSCAFQACEKLSSINLPSSIVCIGNNAFQYSGIKNIVIPNSADLGDGVFKNCINLTNVVIQQGRTEIPKESFWGCQALNNIIIPDGVTTLGESAFRYCGVEHISIPKTVVKIESSAFDDTWGVYDEITDTYHTLSDIYYGGNEDDWDSIETLFSTAATIHYNSYNPFADIYAASWCFSPVLWAYNTGVTTGTTVTTFEPNKTCTRAEFVAFLYKYMGMPWNEAWASECNFSDVKSNNWFYRAVIWANHTGVTHGTTSTTFSPNVTLDRAMVISFLYNMEKYLHGAPKVTLTGTKFTDVSKSSYYYNPVLWAEQYKITNGSTPTAFAPSDNCTRAEAVAFLYNIDKYWN